MPMTERPTPSNVNASVTNDELLILATILADNVRNSHCPQRLMRGEKSKHIRQLDEAHIGSVSLQNFGTMSGRGCPHTSRPERNRRGFFRG